MNKYKLSMKTPSGLGTEYIYVESKYDNFERYLKEHNLKYQKYNFKTNQDKEIERLNNIIKEVREKCDYLLNNDIVEINGRKYIKQEADNIVTSYIKEVLDKEN